MRLTTAVVVGIVTLASLPAGCSGRLSPKRSGVQAGAGQERETAAQDVYLPSDQVSKPVLVRSAKPAYTSAAMRARIQGEVAMQVDVRPDGTVGTVALVKSLYPELDQEAVKAAKQFVFTPGMKDGKPVTVRIDTTVAFNLR